jgi:hypothetical protein
MLAGEPLEPGRLVLSVPEALFMTANSGVASTHCGQLIREAALSEWQVRQGVCGLRTDRCRHAGAVAGSWHSHITKVPPRLQALVLHLLCERAAGQGSFWAPYLTTLGQQEQHPLLWPAQVVQQLHGSAMARTLAARRAVVAQDTEVLVAAGANQLPIAAAWRQAQQAAAGAAADRDDGSAASQQQLVSAASVAWASAVLLSRGFALDLSERDLAAEADMSFWGSWAPHGPASLALVPWADACRHSVDAGAPLRAGVAAAGRCVSVAAAPRTAGQPFRSLCAPTQPHPQALRRCCRLTLTHEWRASSRPRPWRAAPRCATATAPGAVRQTCCWTAAARRRGFGALMGRAATPAAATRTRGGCGCALLRVVCAWSLEQPAAAWCFLGVVCHHLPTVLMLVCVCVCVVNAVRAVMTRSSRWPTCRQHTTRHHREQAVAVLVLALPAAAAPARAAASAAATLRCWRRWASSRE